MTRITYPEVPSYRGEDDIDSVMWDSAQIIDSERDAQSNIAFMGYRVEWEDDEGRRCELTTRTFAEDKLIGQEEADYGQVIYAFRRRNTVDNLDYNYIIRGKSKTIEQRDQAMKMLPKEKRMPRAALIASIIESYDCFSWGEILQSDSYNEDEPSEKEKFNEIVYLFKKEAREGRLRKIGRAVRHLLGYGEE